MNKITRLLFGLFLACAGCRNQGVTSTPPTPVKGQAKSTHVNTLKDFKRMRPSHRFAKYERIHKNAKNAIPWAVEIEKKFSDADHFITHFGIRSEESTIWNSEAHFGGRYIFTMQVPILVDYESENIQIRGEPEFFLTEVTLVNPDGSGSYGETVEFSEKQFEALTNSDWDFSSLKIILNANVVNRFDLLKAMTQSPRYPISLLK